MFQTVGREVDEEAGRRRALAFVLVMFLALCTGAVAVVAGTLTVARVVEEALPDVPMVEVVETEPKIEPPGAPRAPAAPRAASVASVAPIPPLPTDPAPLKDTIPQIQSVVPTGPEGPPGPLAGPPGACTAADCGGSGTATSGSGHGGPVQFHWRELTVRRQVAPIYPDAAKDMNLGDVSCKVRMFIDEAGRPTDLKFEACPLPFQESARTAVMKWRWDPARLGDDAVPAQFVLKIEYRLR